MRAPGIEKVAIELDRERHMVFDLDAFCIYQEITSRNPFVSPPISPVEIRALLYSALKWEDADLTVEAVGKMVHVGNLRSVSEKVGAALAAAMPQPGDLPKVEEAAVAPAS